MTIWSALLLLLRHFVNTGPGCRDHWYCYPMGVHLSSFPTLIHPSTFCLVRVTLRFCCRQTSAEVGGNQTKPHENETRIHLTIVLLDCLSSHNNCINVNFHLSIQYNIQSWAISSENDTNMHFHKCRFLMLYDCKLHIMLWRVIRWIAGNCKSLFAM